MRLALVLAGCAAMVACVFLASEPTLAPELTEAQNERVEFVGIYRTGDTPGQKYSVIGPVEAAACSGSGRPHGADGKAMDILKRKTVALRGDAVVDVSCGGVSLNACSAARKCAGNAVRWN